MAVVQENGHGQLAPGCGEHEIGRMVAVDIARGDLQPAWRSDDANGMGTNSGQMKLNPIICERRIAAAGLNDGQIRPQIAVKVRKGKGSVERNGKKAKRKTTWRAALTMRGLRGEDEEVRRRI